MGQLAPLDGSSEHRINRQSRITMGMTIEQLQQAFESANQNWQTRTAELASAFQTVEAAWTEHQEKFNILEQVHDSKVSELPMIKQEIENTKQRLEATTSLIQVLQHKSGEVDQVYAKIQMLEDQIKATQTSSAMGMMQNKKMDNLINPNNYQPDKFDDKEAG